MDTVILYYSLGGSTKAEAEKIAMERGAALEAIRETHKRNVFTAFLPGCPMALHRKASKIEPLHSDFKSYKRIILMAPVWAGYPAPAFNAVLNLLPEGKEIEVVLCSSGGETPKSIVGTKQRVLAQGCRLISYRDIKTGPAEGSGK